MRGGFIWFSLSLLAGSCTKSYIFIHFLEITSQLSPNIKRPPALREAVSISQCHMAFWAIAINRSPKWDR